MVTQSGVFIFKDVFKETLNLVKQMRGELVDGSTDERKVGKRVSKEARLFGNGQTV